MKEDQAESDTLIGSAISKVNKTRMVSSCIYVAINVCKGFGV